MNSMTHFLYDIVLMVGSERRALKGEQALTVEFLQSGTKVNSQNAIDCVRLNCSAVILNGT